MRSANFLPILFDFLEAIDPIFLIFVLSGMFIILKGLEIVSSPAMPLNSYPLLGIFTCLGVTAISFVLELY